MMPRKTILDGHGLPGGFGFNEAGAMMPRKTRAASAA